MQYNTLENQIAQQLRNYEVAVDTDMLIASIHGEPQRKRRSIFWFFFAGSIIMTMVAYFVFRNTYTPNGKEIKSVSQSFADNTLVVSGTKSQTNTKDENIENSISINDGLKSSLESQLRQARKPSKNFIPTPTINILPKENITGLTPITNQSAIQSYVNVPVNGSSPDDYKVNFMNSKDVTSISRFIPKVTGISRTVKTDKIICPDFRLNKSGFTFAIVPELGGFYPMKSLQNSAPDISGVYNLRSNNEKSLEGFQGAIYLRATGRKTPFFIQAGLSMSSLTEQMKLNYSYVTRDTSQGIISITVSQTGDTITTIWGDIINERKVSGSKNVHHGFTLFDLPIGLGYTHKIGKFGIGIEGGAMINLSMRSNGKILVSDTSFMHVDAVTTNPPFKPALGLSYYAGLHLTRVVSARGEIYLATRIRFIPSAFTKSSASIQQSYNFLGLHVGYIHHF